MGNKKHSASADHLGPGRSLSSYCLLTLGHDMVQLGNMSGLNRKLRVNYLELTASAKDLKHV